MLVTIKFGRTNIVLVNLRSLVVDVFALQLEIAVIARERERERESERERAVIAQC